MTCIRELILENLVSTIETQCSNEVKKVQRWLIRGMDELKQVPQTQLPLVAVIGGLPLPETTSRSNQGGKGGSPFLFNSVLNVGIFTYYSDNDKPDTKLSTLANSLWVGILKDPTRGKLAFKTSIAPDPSAVRLGSTYYGFVLNVKVNYFHDETSI